MISIFFKDRRILITGGTGTIGQSLVRYLLKENPQVIRLLSRDEHKQIEFSNELNNNETLRFLIGDIRDYDRVLSAVHGVDYVFHLAAMKHVPSCEYNPYEAVLTNVIGTQNVIRAASSKNVKKVVFTSTDKAISPTNNYGATKLTAEKLISASEYSKGMSKTTFSAVRFGNVMGSRGSVIPLFMNQIKNQRRVTVTHPEMNRFMMTIDQATSLTVRALQEAKGGELFVLKMPVVYLSDLVSVIMDLASKKFHIDKNDIKVETIGLRPGEKMHEELMTYEESKNAWDLSDMFVVPSPFIQQAYYPNAVKAKHSTYSSGDQKALSYQEVYQYVSEVMEKVEKGV